MPQRARWAWLLAASCLFYMAFVPAYILVLGFTIVVDYAAGLLIERSAGRTRRAWLLASLASNIGVLVFFKYTNFLVDNFNLLSRAFGSAAAWPFLHIVLPIGLSFHTFQAMAYTIEVYYGRQRAERHFGLYALYVMFYPQLVAGPIERPQNLLPQLRAHHDFNYARVTDGLRLMTWGFFQKVVVADRLALIANPVFQRPADFHGLVVILAAVAFTFQIYCDFAAYSNIARGAARVMGIELMVNFRQPFHARSIAEFWTRWHISLSTWFRDYLYIPMGGNRGSRAHHYRNLVVVFLVSGLWHGASWTFIVWGALHATYLLTELVVRPYVPARLRDSANPWLRAAAVGRVFFLVCLAFVFFRAASVGEALTLLMQAPVGLGGDLIAVARHGLQSLVSQPQFPAWREWVIAGYGLALIEGVDLLEGNGSGRVRLSELPGILRWPAYVALVYATVLLTNPRPIQFIYFQF